LPKQGISRWPAGPVGFRELRGSLSGMCVSVPARTPAAVEDFTDRFDASDDYLDLELGAAF
jgi:hypothetical protein